MAEIPLRSYLHDIEKHIESGRTDQAIAHCRHILQFYTKYVDAYRLLGKAYLECQRYGDAGDIFQRVLSSVPDDFVAHVGMSIIREDEGNLDESIWHMERAFEVQPSNNAIQEELRRLFGKRDHVEPPKIRLTRGALSRMYYKGELYQQAIGEIRAALGENPERLDLQALLADIHLKINQNVEAAETALGVLRRLPNCLVANRVMIQVLASAQREMEQKSYQQRLGQLDPYSVYAALDAANSDSVSEHVIQIEKLDWKPDSSLTGEAGQPAWAASLGVDLGDLAPEKEETLPDWLSGVAPEPSAANKTAEGEPAAFVLEGATTEAVEESALNQGISEEEIPEWLREAGWGPSTGAAEQAEAITQPDTELETESSIDQGEDYISEAEIPDWLKAMAPMIDQEEPPQPEEEEEDVTPWVEKLIPATDNKIQEPMTEPEITAPEPESVEEPVFPAEGSAGASEATEWLQGIEPPLDEAPPVEAEPAAPIPDWLVATDVPMSPSETTAEEGLAGDEPEQVAGLPDWLAGMEEAIPIADDADMIAVEPIEATTEQPEWMIAASEVNMAETSDEWQAQSETQPESLLSEEMAAELPDWLLQDEAPSEEIASIEPPEPTWEDAASGEGEAELAEELPAWLFKTDETLPTQESSSEIDAEGLAEASSDSDADVGLPDWLLESALPEAEVASIPVEPAITESDEFELPDWLPETTPVQDADTSFEAQASPSEPAETSLPDWLMGVAPAEEEKTIINGEEQAFEPTGSELPEWVFDAELTEPVEASVPSEAEPDAGIPAWLFESEEDAEFPAEPAVVEGDTQPAHLKKAQPIAVPSEPPPETKAASESMAADRMELEDAFTWLVDLETAAKQGQPAVTDAGLEMVGGIPEAIPEEEELVSEVQNLDLRDESLETVILAPTAPESSVAVEPDAPETLIDQDAAFAWLESLAVKQGANEALILEPEQRLETMPDWVREDALAAASQAEREISPIEQPIQMEAEAAVEELTVQSTLETLEGLEDIIGSDEIPPILDVMQPLEEAGVEEEGAIADVQSAGEEELFFEELTPIQEQVIPEETPPGELGITEEAMGIEEESPLQSSVVSEEEAPMEESDVVSIATKLSPEEPVAEETPALPDWLTESAISPREEIEWTPPAIPQRRYDLNQVSLSELERLPGVGFIIAQQITSYRELHGPYSSIHDLLNISDISPALLESIRDYIFVPVSEEFAPTPLEPITLPEVQEMTPELAEARTHLTSGALEQALEKYAELIHSNQSLEFIIQDLEEATFRFPSEINIWQNLGDAYLRTDRVQDALQAFIKAEQLLR